MTADEATGVTGCRRQVDICVGPPDWSIAVPPDNTSDVSIGSNSHVRCRVLDNGTHSSVADDTADLIGAGDCPRNGHIRDRSSREIAHEPTDLVISSDVNVHQIEIPDVDALAVPEQSNF
ncbi:hypothetical protein [Natronolimnohabitans innermongolicus]|uniref:hypothetical protein n=1 Tax=Natronolimnohabitans innermongolicus TaxID=253107 RepID=UPI0013760B4A|nr:hypothetical protein [Natronolimnohabitans innermongolicus]